VDTEETTTGAGTPAATRIERSLEVPVEEAELWAAVGDGAAWASWLVDESDVAVVPGSGGTVVDEGQRRHVAVERVVPGRAVEFRWWPEGDEDASSVVTLVVAPAGAGASRLLVVERPAVVAHAQAPSLSSLAMLRLWLAVVSVPSLVRA
jgi:uncharacterized protein YndB with AHSA1/START domain